MFNQILDFLQAIILLLLGYWAGRGARLELPRQGVLPAIKKKLTGASGGVLTPEDPGEKKRRIKGQYLEAVQQDPTLPLPRGLSTDDFYDDEDDLSDAN